jgi:hypothetical protein
VSAITGFLVEEEVYDSHFRVVKVTTDDSVVFSIDYYKNLPSKPSCKTVLKRSGVELCYIDLGDNCIAVISEVSGRVELVNLRLITNP